MPKGRTPPDPGASAASAFAFRLYELWQSAGEPTVRAMGQAGHTSHSSISRATKGDKLPTWDVTKAFVTACGAAEQDWQPLWRAAAKAVAAEKQIAKDPTVPICPIPSRAPTDRSANTTTARTTQRRPAAKEAPPQRERGTSPQPPKDRDEVPLLPMSLNKDTVDRLTSVRLLQALHAARSMAEPPDAVLAQMLDSDDRTVVECLINIVLALRAQINRLQHTPTASSPPPSANPLTPTLVPAERGSPQLTILGNSSRPPGAHRKPTTQEAAA